MVYAFLDLPAEYGVHIGVLDKLLGLIPLYNYGFGWVVPAVAGFIIGLLVYPRLGKANQ